MTKEQVTRIAAYLNGRALGKTTKTAVDGIPDVTYWTLVQLAGKRDGLYPSPPYKLDGKAGPKTYGLEKHYLALATSATPVVTPVVVPPASSASLTAKQIEDATFKGVMRAAGEIAKATADLIAERGRA